MFVERPILENGTAVEHYTYLVWFLSVLAVITDLCSVGPQFLRWKESGMILVEDLLYELNAMSYFSVLPFVKSSFFMASSHFMQCSRLFGKVTWSLLKGSGISQFPFSFCSNSCECWNYFLDSYFSIPGMSREWWSSLRPTCWGEVISMSAVWQRRPYILAGSFLSLLLLQSSLALLLGGTMKWFWKISRCLLMRLMVPQSSLLSRHTGLITVQPNISSSVRGSFYLP